MAKDNPLPLYYQGISLADMEAKLREGYLTSSGWLESAKTKLAVRNGQPIPWFTYAAIRFLEQEITSNISIFEFGGGQSTLYWAGRVRKVVSIDHDPVFVKHVRHHLPANAEMHFVEEGPAPEHILDQLAGRVPVLKDPEVSGH